MSSLKNVPGTYTARDYSFRRKIQALLMFRLLMAVFFLLLTLLVQSGRHEDLLAGHLQPLYFFSVLLFGFTIFASLDLKNVRNLRRFAYAQLFFDVEAVTFLVFMSGGVESLFSFLYMPVIISASILLLRRGSLVVATLAGVSYGLLLDFQYLGWIHPLQMVRSQSFFLDSNAYLHALLLNVFAFYAVGVLSGYLAEELQKSSLQLSQKQKDLERLEALHRNIVRSMSSGLITVDVGNRVLYANEAARKLDMVTLGQLVGRSVLTGLKGEARLRVKSILTRFRRDGSGLVTRSIRRGERFLEERYQGVADHDGHFQGMILMYEDVTDRVMETEEANRLACEDALTGLGNRRAFDDALARQMLFSMRQHCALSLLFIDIDGFKSFNDTHGHQAGDLALQQVARVLRRSVREHVDEIYRYGGDEFVVLLPATRFDEARTAAERISQVFAEDGVEGLGLSVGMSLYRRGEGARQFVERADRALYRAKARGGGVIEEL